MERAMSQESSSINTDKSIAPLLIDLNNAQQASILDAASLLHKVQLEFFFKRVGKVVQRTDEFKIELNESRVKEPVGYSRYHDVIIVHGKRGSGKTTFLLTALSLLQQPQKRKQYWPQEEAFHSYLDNLCVLEILDPTLFGLHEHLLFSLLGKIAQKVRTYRNTHASSLCDGFSSACRVEAWEKSLRRLAKGLKYIGESRDDVSRPLFTESGKWEDPEFLLEEGMDNARSGVELERQFHRFLDESLAILGKKAFVLALDDIDTRPAIGWHVLEVLRRYFTSPQLVVIISGDMDLFKTLIEKRQLSIFGLDYTSDKDLLQQFKTRVDGLTEQYLLKILRTQNRINLGSFDWALQQFGRPHKNIKCSVRKGEAVYELEMFLAEKFYSFLSCRTKEEQVLFRQTLFANPARTVVQTLDGLMELQGQELATRLSEVFLIPLQNLGFEHPFDLTEALQTPQGIAILMRNLFTRDFVARGLDLLPVRREQAENDALLALQGELTQAMHAKPSVLFAYLFKACLLQQVLALKDKEITEGEYASIEAYLGVEGRVRFGALVSRISALHLGDPATNNALRYRGVIRLYRSSASQNEPEVMKAMYGATVEELEAEGGEEQIPSELKEFRTVVSVCSLKSAPVPIRCWVNTPESLRDMMSPWQQDLAYLGLLEVRRGSRNFRAFSIFPVLAIMGDILECEPSEVASLFAQNGQILNIGVCNWSNKDSHSQGQSTFGGWRGSEKDNDKNRLMGLSAEEDRRKTFFWTGITQWKMRYERDSLRTMLPATLCARIMARFFSSLANAEREVKDHDIFVGSYIHRCLVTFLNSVLVEEFLLSENNASTSSAKISLENPTTSDDVFLKNILDSQFFSMVDARALDSPPEKFRAPFTVIAGGNAVSVNAMRNVYPLFNAIFTFPLWGFYLNPTETLESDTANTVYGIYMRLQSERYEIPKKTYEIGYTTEEYAFANLYPLLNSLAIPKLTITRKKKLASFFVSRTGIPADPRTSEGIRANLSRTTKNLQYKKIIDDIRVNAPSLLEGYIGVGPAMHESFPRTFNEIIDRYYTSAESNARFRTEEECKKFWAKARRYINSWR